jgi:hypothetical protein
MRASTRRRARGTRYERPANRAHSIYSPLSPKEWPLVRILLGAFFLQIAYFSVAGVRPRTTPGRRNRAFHQGKRSPCRKPRYSSPVRKLVAHVNVGVRLTTATGSCPGARLARSLPASSFGACRSVSASMAGGSRSAFSRLEASKKRPSVSAVGPSGLETSSPTRGLPFRPRRC